MAEIQKIRKLEGINLYPPISNERTYYTSSLKNPSCSKRTRISVDGLNGITNSTYRIQKRKLSEKDPEPISRVNLGITSNLSITDPFPCPHSRKIGEFEKLSKIGEGTFGMVYKARDKSTGELVALKMLKPNIVNHTKNLRWKREIDILTSCRNPSIVELKEVLFTPNGCDKSIYLVMEYIEKDLHGVMQKRWSPFHETDVKSFMKQLLSGVKYLHDRNILHRDLKPSNILVHDNNTLKICDFGSSRVIGSGPYTQPVVSQWYRAPELLRGSRKYNTAIDMWSLGCIMAELLSKEVLFRGSTEIDQLKKINEAIARPGACNGLRKMFPVTGFSGRPTLSSSGFDLLSGLLSYEPSKRLTADAALRHPWFDEAPSSPVPVGVFSSSYYVPDVHKKFVM
jgi:cell division cycle 2-like protein